MRRYFLSCDVAAIVVAVTAAIPVAAAAQSPSSGPGRDSASREKAVDAATRERVAARAEKIVAAEPGGFSGTLFVALDGAVVLDRGFGLADSRKKIPTAADALWDWSAIAPLVTAVAALRLVDARRLRLDAPLVSLYDDVPEDKAQTKLRDFLTHVSGIDESKASFVGGRLTHRKELERIVFGLPTRGVVGETSRVSGLGIIFAAAVVEHVAKEPYEAFCEREVFKPAGMRDAKFVGDAGIDRARVPKAARGEGFAGSRRGQTFAYGDRLTWGYRGAGGVVATARDIGRLDAALRGETLLSKTSREELHRAGVGGVSPAGGRHVTERGDARYGLGGRVEGAFTYVLRTPRRGLVVAVACSHATTRPLEEFAYALAGAAGDSY